MDYTGYILCSAGSDELSQIIIFLIILAIGLIGNISKAKAQKRTGRTGDRRPEHKPSGEPSNSQTSHARARLEPNPKTQEGVPKYYEPGGFSEVLQDEVLERTLKKSRVKKRASGFHATLGMGEEPIVQPTLDTEVMAENLESMGQLETLDPAKSVLASDVISSRLTFFADQEDLARAVLYAEIISKPVGIEERVVR